MTLTISGLYLEYLFLLFIRILAIFGAAPIFGHRSFPMVAKIGLAFTVAFVLLGVAPTWLGPLPPDIASFLLLVVREVFIGLLLGFIASLAFVVLQMAGALVGSAMGLNLASTFNPVTGTPSSVTDQFYVLLTSLVFLSLNGLHWLLQGVNRSLMLAPLGGPGPDLRLTERLIPMTAWLFVAALEIALPVMGTLILAEIAMGLVNRAVPQMNVFMIGLPLRAWLALFTLVVTLPLLGGPVARVLQTGFAGWNLILKP
ncbi:MAG: flagellar biosynthetic protein FliR [Chloroflexi bacterium RBG_16_57_9]|nr:MAG: flagellar biosynthetic protein FliR [Chloroflexi bacterium RBG_16_57_9]